MKRMAFCLIALVPSGPAKADDWSKFFFAVPPAAPLADMAEKPEVRGPSGAPEGEVAAMWARGYTMVGYTTFNGKLKNKAGALKQAQRLKARYVVTTAQYTSTTRSAIPLTLPRTTTSTTDGTVQVVGGGRANFAATTTYQGAQTTFIPFSVHRYEQFAAYFAPVQKVGAGILSRELTQAEKVAIGSNRGFGVIAVRERSPAFNADILPGDIVTKLDGKPIEDSAWSSLVAARQGQSAAITVVRSGTEKQLMMTMNPES